MMAWVPESLWEAKSRSSAQSLHSWTPFTFTPYALQHQETSRAKDLDQLFPILDPEAKLSIKPKLYASLLWKQLNHLGNAGFDPAIFRVDSYGNVLYYHADSASPLAWDIDHWFPCSRGGLTVPSNLRVLQWQVCKRKHNKLEFLVPWWDFQLGISVNQFLSMFASSNSDFRNRAFSLLFSEGENEELNDSQTVNSHVFPQPFKEARRKLGLAPAAIVLSRREPYDASTALNFNETLGDGNESLFKSNQTPRPSISKENDNPNTNPYLAIAMARDSLRQKEEMQLEIEKIDEELDGLQQKNDTERIALQDLELVLIKRRRRAEKSRRLAEAQSSYKALLEKMIRDAMHQSVLYKEQLRLNQTAASALMARLEAQKAICDSSEQDLHRKFKHRDELEKQIKPYWDQTRKRLRVDTPQLEERDNNNRLLYLPAITPKIKGLHKELRVYLEEEQKASEAGISPTEEQHQDIKEDETCLRSNIVQDNGKEWRKPWISLENETAIMNKLKRLEIQEGKKKVKSTPCSTLQSPEREQEDEEYRNLQGKGNVEKWLEMLLEDTNEDFSRNAALQENTNEEETSKTDEIIGKLNSRNPQKEVRILKFPTIEQNTGLAPVYEEIDPPKLSDKANASQVCSVGKGVGSRSKRFEAKERRDRSVKENGLARCESARTFRTAPYSPSVILGMKKRVDCMGKKPIVIGSDEDLDENNFIKSIKKAVKI
ncbi:hypothetical protein GIB67_031266 [Kingdonia uniflora]|uniref:Uncharacterized protein n=1 Tax=Kingdonia uniflora TaxID=39325 RepID=A0A7J7LME3_9MAGN|nr:hypothetical protein GIB67_031266 [Kingdonia uniflora]